jgi:hypothetical protein
MLSETPLDGVMEQNRVRRVGRVSGPVADMPRLVRARQVVDDMLWEFILPEVPVHVAMKVSPRMIDELLSAAVEELKVDSETEFSSKEPLPDDVARLFRSYGPRGGGDVPDD